jgi:hypothetical protein
MIAAVSLGVLPLLTGLCLWLILLGTLGWLRWADVRRGLDPELIIMLTSALTLSSLLQSSGSKAVALPSGLQAF